MGDLAVEAPMTEQALVDGQIDISNRLFSFVDSMTLKCAVELRIADIIHSHGCPLSLSQIASGINQNSPSSPPINQPNLQRVMRKLEQMKIFTKTYTATDVVYGLTPSSVSLLHDADITLAPFLLWQNDPTSLSTLHYLSACVKDPQGMVTGFQEGHGTKNVFAMAKADPEYNKIFNAAMKSWCTVFAKAVLSGYKDGFGKIQTLVEVGGGVGFLLSEVVKNFPHIKGTNFDLPHVVEMALDNGLISHVSGNMFEDDIPSADAIMMKNILHDWGDEDCIKILKNCRKTIGNNKSGKLIIVDIVIREGGPSSQGPLHDFVVTFDIVMLAHTSGGKERTEEEWKKLFAAGGFPRINVIDLPIYASIIEAYTE
ncbi:hypothetical protein Leryth_013154 [Lithospermum erythrorhizon]|nr:hypothetical protein Leryth_013154 [Lithospermum erythrorhizon]